MSMAQYECRTRTTTVHEYVMPNPVNLAEFSKAMAYAYQEHSGAGRYTSDDSIWVTHTDDEIIIYWEEN